MCVCASIWWAFAALVARRAFLYLYFTVMLCWLRQIIFFLLLLQVGGEKVSRLDTIPERDRPAYTDRFIIANTRVICADARKKCAGGSSVWFEKCSRRKRCETMTSKQRYTKTPGNRNRQLAVSSVVKRTKLHPSIQSAGARPGKPSVRDHVEHACCQCVRWPRKLGHPRRQCRCGDRCLPLRPGVNSRQVNHGTTRPYNDFGYRLRVESATPHVGHVAILLGKVQPPA